MHLFYFFKCKCIKYYESFRNSYENILKIKKSKKKVKKMNYKSIVMSGNRTYCKKCKTTQRSNHSAVPADLLRESDFYGYLFYIGRL